MDTGLSDIVWFYIYNKSFTAPEAGCRGEREDIMKTFLKAAAGVSIAALVVFGVKTLWEKYREGQY